ncbi:MAG: tripartite tricarboxylate transporter substrate binding protein, partial [Betaproteobacteria bacterium]|nr:tripartite tricarboxylate transporter substrate binding protein [Betaproteobacteria bacterium]
MWIALKFLAALFCTGAALAQSWPDRPLRLVVPFPAGGTVDAVARIAAQRLADSVMQPVVVDNRAGAGGSIGTEAMARAAADGYTLLMGTGSTHGTNPSVLKNLPYDPVRDFAPVSLLGTSPYILVVNSNVPVNSTAELVAYAKAQPGKLNFGTYGSGSSNHLATELFRSMTGVDVVHVPYKGAAPAITALIAGEVQFMFDVVGTSMPHIRSGKFKLLGTGALKRPSLLPDTPTLTEAGAQGYEAGTFFAIFAPAGTPPPVIAALNRELVRAVTQPEVRERLTTLGVEVVGSTPAQLGETVAAEVRKWALLVRER